MITVLVTPTNFGKKKRITVKKAFGPYYKYMKSNQVHYVRVQTVTN